MTEREVQQTGAPVGTAADNRWNWSSFQSQFAQALEHLRSGNSL
jgi:hypothetical protein